MKTKRVPVPANTLLKEYLKDNYSDCYSSEFTTDKEITPDKIMLSFWTKKPDWIDFMFRLRNVLVKPFGLDKGAKKDDFMISFKKCIESGENSDYMSVWEKSPDETVLCLDDKHLKAFLSVHIEKTEDKSKKVSLITVVEFKYWLGYCYFYAIAPFHHLIVKNMLAYTMKRMLEEDK